MADIPQWRRVIPPSRSRTPMIEVTEFDQVARPAASSRPPTPKKGLRPKLSSYLSQSGTFGVAVKPEPDPVFAESPSQSFPSWAVEDTFPQPSAGRLIDTIMCRLMSDPYEALDSRFNGALLQISEAYRHLKDEQALLEKQVSDEADARSVERSAMQHAEAKWEEERQTYKAEVKRLELVIARGKRGVAEVALVRQDSLLHRRQQMTTPEDEDDGKETVFEFLEKTKRFEDPAWSSQRATMRNRPASPSARMAKLSKKLTKKISKTSILADLPFGTPPPHIPSTSLQASFLEDQAENSEKKTSHTFPQRKSEGRVSFSDDTSSTFSCVGDFLPDEHTDKELHSHDVIPDDNVADTDLEDIRQMAATISRRRGVDAESIMPRLMELFSSQAPPNDASSQQLNAMQIQRVATAPLKRSSGTTPIRKPSQIRGFINRFRPQLSLDTTPDIRRFSFEVGDDSAPIEADYQNPLSRDNLLRKSVSLSCLSETARRIPTKTTYGDLSPIPSSPSTSTRTNDSRPSSKIPSPAYNAALAKPRQQREDSSNSLVTALKDSEQTGHRSSSAASSVYSSHSHHQVATNSARNAAHPSQVQTGHKIASRLEQQRRHGFSSLDAAGTPSNRQLIDHTNAVRAGTSISGSTVSARDGGKSGVPDIKLHSPTRGGNEGRSRIAQNAAVQPTGAVSENEYPLLHLRHGGKDSDVVAEDRQELQEMAPWRG